MNILNLSWKEIYVSLFLHVKDTIVLNIAHELLFCTSHCMVARNKSHVELE